jgi:hypothetical protein
MNLCLTETQGMHYMGIINCKCMYSFSERSTVLVQSRIRLVFYIQNELLHYLEHLFFQRASSLKYTKTFQPTQKLRYPNSDLQLLLLKHF